MAIFSDSDKIAIKPRMDQPTHLAQNLRRARLARGWTQADASSRSGHSLAGYRDLEAGRGAPRAGTLRSIADAFQVPLVELLRPVRALRHVRFRSEKRMKRRAQVLADIARVLDARDELELALAPPHDMRGFVSSSPWIAADRVAEVSTTDPREAARDARRAFGLDDRLPIHDLGRVLEDHGIRVVALTIESIAFTGLTVAEPGSPPLLGVNTWSRRPVEAWIASAVRELGHLALHPDSFDVDRTEWDRREQIDADVFASEFLMPGQGFALEWNSTAGLSLLERVLVVKRAFRVSWRMVASRAAERLPASEAIALWRRVHEEYERSAGRGLLSRAELEGLERRPNADLPSLMARRPEPAPLDVHDFPLHRTRLLVRRAMESGAISLGRGAEILGLSLVEMRIAAAAWIG